MGKYNVSYCCDLKRRPLLPFSVWYSSRSAFILLFDVSGTHYTPYAHHHTTAPSMTINKEAEYRKADNLVYVQMDTLVRQ